MWDLFKEKQEAKPGSETEWLDRLRIKDDLVQRLANELHDEYVKRHQRERANATREQSCDFADWSMKEIGLIKGDRKWEQIR